MPASKTPAAKKPTPERPPPEWWNRPTVLRRLLACAAAVIVILIVAVIVLAITERDSGGRQAAATPTSGYSPYNFPTTTANPPTTTAVAGPSKLGEPITLSSRGSQILAYSVTSINVDSPCPTRMGDNTPQHGHMVLAALDVQTSGFYTSEYDQILSASKKGWSIIGPDGISETPRDNFVLWL